MREKIFRHLLTKLERYTPGLIKSIQIQILLNATAAAFDRPGRMVWHLPEKKALAAYAEYTRACVPQRPDAANSVAGSECGKQYGGPGEDAANSMAGQRSDQSEEDLPMRIPPGAQDSEDHGFFRQRRPGKACLLSVQQYRDKDDGPAARRDLHSLLLFRGCVHARAVQDHVADGLGCDCRYMRRRKA